MKEGHFDIRTASLVESQTAAGEGVAEIEVIDESASLEREYNELAEKLAALESTPLCQLIDSKPREGLTETERCVQSNRAQASTFLRKAHEQLSLLSTITEYGADTSTQVGHIKQSFEIIKQRLAAAQVDIPANRIEPTQPIEQLAEPELVLSELEVMNPTHAVIDAITDMQGRLTKTTTEKQKEVEGETAALLGLNKRLIQLDRRYQLYSEDSSLVEVQSTGETVSLLHEYQTLATSYAKLLHDVHILRTMSEQDMGGKDFPEILKSREAALTTLANEYNAFIKEHPEVVEAELAAAVSAAKEQHNPVSGSERLTGGIPPLEPEPQMDPQVVFNEDTDKQPKYTFSHKQGVIDASPQSDDVVFYEVKNEDTVEAMQKIMNEVNKTVAQSEKEENRQQEMTELPVVQRELTIDTLKEFIQNYKGGSEAFDEYFQTWVDSIQGIHSSRWKPIALFNARESYADAYSVLKGMTVSQFRDMIRMPESARQTKLHELKITSDDFEQWQREFNLAAMVDDLRIIMNERELTFEEWARYSCAVTKISEEQLAR